MICNFLNLLGRLLLRTLRVIIKLNLLIVIKKMKREIRVCLGLRSNSENGEIQIKVKNKNKFLNHI